MQTKAAYRPLPPLKVGDRIYYGDLKDGYDDDTDCYIIACVDHDKVQLINLHSGNRWASAKPFTNFELTKTEMLRLVENNPFCIKTPGGMRSVKDAYP